nr:hypothetical protein [Chloroflexia bacterium]
MDQSERMLESAEGDAAGERFEWHPEYRGQSVAAVRQSIRADLGHDQRAYALAIDGAEHAEHASLSTVIDLEKKWGAYNLDWSDADPDTLTEQIVAFERERERRRELFAWREQRRDQTVTPPPRAIGGLTTGTSSP